jgi:protein MpaA
MQYRRQIQKKGAKSQNLILKGIKLGTIRNFCWKLVLFSLCILFFYTNIFSVFTLRDADRRNHKKSFDLTFVKQVNAHVLGYDVISMTPSDGALKVNRSAAVEFELDKTIAQRDLKQFFSIEPHVNGNIEIEDNIFRFVPSEKYKYGVEYTVEFSHPKKCLVDTHEDNCTGKHVYWNSSFRAEAHRRILVGYSEEGRGIYADVYGSGNDNYFYVSALHGSEPITITIAQKWSQYLDSNQDIIPEDKTLVIVAKANPDGVVHGIRWNANHVDLNRNWPTDDWQPHSWWGSYYCIWCGGAYPASEKETQVLRDLMLQRGADALFSYHAAGDIVVAGDRDHAKSVEWSQDYANLSGIAYGSGGWTAYPITGDMNVWAVEDLNIPSVLVENPSGVNDYFSNHLLALLNTLEY